MIKKEMTWIPFTFDENGLLNCPVPDNDQEVLISNGKNVWGDTFMNDGEECWLDYVDTNLAGLAWKPLPEPHIIRDESIKEQEAEKQAENSEKYS